MGEKIMAALGIIALFVTGFVFVYYSYLSNHGEKDVSFFLSVCIISLFMNLCTNDGGVFGLSVLYLVVDAVFIGVGFLVDLGETLNFYNSIGPWFQRTFTNMKLIGWQVLSAVLFPVGIGLYFGNYKDQPELAKECGKASALGFVLCMMLLWTVLGMVL